MEKKQEDQYNITIDEELQDRLNKINSISIYDWFFNGNISEFKIVYNNDVENFEFKF